jgi:hypothetical protein
MPIQGVASDQFFVNPAGNGIVSSTAPADQVQPELTLLSDGRFVFVWVSRAVDEDGDGDFCVRARVFNADGTPQGNDFIVETTTDGNQQVPTVSALSDGRFVVTWRSDDLGDGSNSCIRARIFDADDPSTAADDFVVNSTTDNFQLSPSVAKLTNGNFVVLWHSFESPGDGSANTLRGRLFDSTGTPIDDDFIVNTTTAGAQNSAWVVPRGNGFAAVWLSQESPTSYRAGLFNADGTPNGNDFLVNTSPTNEVGLVPSITVLADGRLVVTWASTDLTSGSGNSQDGSENCIRARIVGTDGVPIGSDFIVNSTPDGRQTDPTVVTLADGRFIFAWTSADTGDGSNGCVRARIYNLNGTANGADFILPFATASDQLAPSIQALADGRLVATWASFDNGDGDGSCIRAQFFDPKIFTGTANADTWKGGNFADQISGEAGTDTLTGGFSKDRLTGGDDGDIFNFDFRGETRKGAGRDVITDFQHGIDDIDLSGIDARSGANNQAFKWIGGADFHDRKGELHFVKINKPGQLQDKTIIEGDVNGDGRADFQIELSGLIHLSKGDFVL